MSLGNNIKKLLESLYNSIKRFPLTLIFTAVIAVTLIVMDKYSAKIPSDTMDQIGRMLLSIALGIPFSLCIKLFFENLQKVRGSLLSCWSTYLC